MKVLLRRVCERERRQKANIMDSIGPEIIKKRLDRDSSRKRWEGLLDIQRDRKSIKIRNPKIDW